MARLGESYRKVRDTLRYEGIAILLWKVLQRVANRLWQIEAEIWFDKDLSRPLPEVTARCDIQIAEASEFDVPNLVALELEPFRSLAPSLLADETRIRNEIYRDDIRRGETFFVAAVGSAIAHINWTHYVMLRPAFGQPIILDGSEVLTTGAYTPSRWRGLGIHAAVLNHMLRVAQERGRKVAYTTTMLSNRRSRKAILRLGWSVRGVLFYCRGKRGNRVYSIWYGGRHVPLPPLRQDDPRRLWRRSHALGRDRCVVLAAFRSTPR